MTDVRARLGAAVRAHRERQRLTQEQLAERSGLSYKFIGEIERGDGNPTVETLERLADGLGLSIAMLFHEADQQRSPAQYQITKDELARVREAVESIAAVADAVGREVPRGRPRRRRAR